MAEMTIRLRIDPNTGKKDIIISLHSDADALPYEHEQQHRALVGPVRPRDAEGSHQKGQSDEQPRSPVETPVDRPLQ